MLYIYNLQFRFRQQCSISRALININVNITEALDDGNIGCGVFVNLQKAFDTISKTESLWDSWGFK